MPTVRPLTPERAPAWDAFVAAHPNGTFFHRAAWAGVLARAFGHIPHYLLAEQDGAVVGVLPLARVKTRLFGDSLVSAPFCVYGGPLAADPAAAQALQAEADALMARLAAPVMEWRFRDPPPDGTLDDRWAARDDLYVTFRKPIAPDDDANMKAIPRKQRAMIRKAIDRGLAASVGQDVDAMFPVYAESVRNLGTPSSPAATSASWPTSSATTWTSSSSATRARPSPPC